MHDDPKLADIEQRIAQLKARKAKLLNRRKSEDRKLDVRRKIIAGALALEHAKHDPAFDSTLQDILDRYVTKLDERALFGLDPVKRESSPCEGAQPASDQHDRESCAASTMFNQA